MDVKRHQKIMKNSKFEKTHFGVLELFEGKQHRQHAAMVVMSMLGFYFEPARHDRDKYIRVHVRHIRPDKLHHFEKMRAEATLPLPYDYDSATHPAWQFWRQVGRTGISTVATYKDKRTRPIHATNVVAGLLLLQHDR
ncbi:hypothetical protein RR46_07080 [Papilio xuthus]|uniref:Peptidase M12A domain-containing protein n=1 Tax=Papilio xuthus TaxID=66420 RepID=A0A194Q658_PAPXU|nr:hypothetical protein RR46_07080 [Papilio xuthus]